MVSLANKNEALEIAKLLQKYSKTIDINCANDGFSLQKTTDLISFCISQKLAWVAKKEGEIVGCSVAQEQHSIFSDSVKEIHLLAIYVLPKFRNSIIGGRLLLAFDKESSLRGNSVNWLGVQYTSEFKEKSLIKLGYRVSEITYIKEK